MARIKYHGDSIWSYRSFLNVTDLNVKPDDLELGDGTMKLFISENGEISGTIGTDGQWSLDLKGKVLESKPLGLEIIGTGYNGQGSHRAYWEYGYNVYFLPKVEGGELQATVLAGSVVRLKDHPPLSGNGPIHKAGEVATCYAVDVTEPA